MGRGTEEATIDAKRAKRIIESGRSNPVMWIENVLGVRLWSKQKEIVRAVRDEPRVAVRAGHNVGKSFVAACLALWFLYSFRPSKVVTTAPTWRQVREILWREIRATLISSDL